MREPMDSFIPGYPPADPAARAWVLKQIKETPK